MAQLAGQHEYSSDYLLVLPGHDACELHVENLGSQGLGQLIRLVGKTKSTWVSGGRQSYSRVPGVPGALPSFVKVVLASHQKRIWAVSGAPRGLPGWVFGFITDHTIAKRL